MASVGVRWSLTSLALIVVACFSATDVFHLASAQGSAFPMDSENYIIQEFRLINPRLIWDESNFLTDLSGHYSVCSGLSTDRGPIDVERETPEGDSVVGYVDYTRGSGTDVNSVTDYLRTMVDAWTRDGGGGVLHEYIRGANRFGCSVRPGCNGHVVTTCLFSPGEYSTNSPNPKPLLLPSGTAPPAAVATTTTTERTTPRTNATSMVFRLSPALAFTPEQYEMAERIARMTWDRSHFLENLSGWETNCSMIGHCPGWRFTEAEGYGATRTPRLDIKGGCGFSPNRGSTPEALEEILGAVKHFSDARSIGCSLIPDCRFPDPGPEYGRMYVVVSCLYLSL